MLAQILPLRMPRYLLPLTLLMLLFQLAHIFQQISLRLLQSDSGGPQVMAVVAVQLGTESG